MEFKPSGQYLTNEKAYEICATRHERKTGFTKFLGLITLLLIGPSEDNKKTLKPLSY